MKEKILVEMVLNDKQNEKFIKFLIKERVLHNIYTFTIGTIGRINPEEMEEEK